MVIINRDNSNHPTLVWGPYSDNNTPHFVPVKYRIYRSYGTISEIIGQTDNANTFSFTDNNVSPTLRPTNFNYYVCGLNSNNTESSPTNTVIFAGILDADKIKPNLASKNQPQDVFLSQNFPNPFNPTSQISFSLPQPSLTQLKVYDVFGRELQTLVDGLLAEGNHSYSFNGKDLASGVYFYTLKTGNYTATKKMILTK